MKDGPSQSSRATAHCPPKPARRPRLSVTKDKENPSNDALSKSNEFCTEIRVSLKTDQLIVKQSVEEEFDCRPDLSNETQELSDLNVDRNDSARKRDHPLVEVDQTLEPKKFKYSHCADQIKACFRLQHSHLPYCDVPAEDTGGIYKIAYKWNTIYIGEAPTSIRNHLNEHMSGKDHLEIGQFLSGLQTLDKYMNVTVFWLDKSTTNHSCPENSFLHCIEKIEGNKPKYNQSLVSDPTVVHNKLQDTKPKQLVGEAKEKRLVSEAKEKQLLVVGKAKEAPKNSTHSLSSRNKHRVENVAVQPLSKVKCRDKLATKIKKTQKEMKKATKLELKQNQDDDGCSSVINSAKDTGTHVFKDTKARRKKTIVKNTPDICSDGYIIKVERADQDESITTGNTDECNGKHIFGRTSGSLTRHTGCFEASSSCNSSNHHSDKPRRRTFDNNVQGTDGDPDKGIADETAICSNKNKTKENKIHYSMLRTDADEKLGMSDRTAICSNKNKTKENKIRYSMLRTDADEELGMSDRTAICSNKNKTKENKIHYSMLRTDADEKLGMSDRTAICSNKNKTKENKIRYSMLRTDADEELGMSDRTAICSNKNKTKENKIRYSMLRTDADEELGMSDRTAVCSNKNKTKENKIHYSMLRTDADEELGMPDRAAVCSKINQNKDKQYLPMLDHHQGDNVYVPRWNKSSNGTSTGNQNYIGRPARGSNADSFWLSNNNRTELDVSNHRACVLPASLQDVLHSNTHKSRSSEFDRRNSSNFNRGASNRKTANENQKCSFWKVKNDNINNNCPEQYRNISVDKQQMMNNTLSKNVSQLNGGNGSKLECNNTLSKNVNGGNGSKLECNNTLSKNVNGGNVSKLEGNVNAPKGSINLNPIQNTSLQAQRFVSPKVPLREICHTKPLLNRPKERNIWNCSQQWVRENRTLDVAGHSRERHFSDVLLHDGGSRVCGEMPSGQYPPDTNSSGQYRTGKTSGQNLTGQMPDISRERTSNSRRLPGMLNAPLNPTLPPPPKPKRCRNIKYS